MKFITSRIHTGMAVSLEEAAKKAPQGQNVKSLDEILEDLKKGPASEQVVKTASTEKAMTKTASTESVVAKKEDDKEEDEVEVVEVEEKDEKKEKKEDEKDAKCASKNSTLKIAKKLDFRGWSAESIIKAWDDHKDVKGCIASVKGQVNAPEVYCGLLQVASEEANKIVKTAKAQKKETIAKTEASSKGFEKLAKMSKEQIQLLKEYFTPLYGEKYTDSLLGDY